MSIPKPIYIAGVKSHPCFTPLWCAEDGNISLRISLALFGCFWLSSENIFLFLVFWETPKQLLNALNFNQTRAQDKALRIGGTRYAGEQYH